MRVLSKKTVVVVIGLAAMVLVSGCTNWKKKYSALDVEHENLKGLFQREQMDRGQLAEQLSQSQQMIEDLQRQIKEQKKSPAEATGFGEGYDVAFDPSAGTITVTLENKILFSPGKATLKRDANAKLNHIESVLGSKYRGKYIDVVGHTDSDPIKKSPWKDNWELSAQRALTVLRYLAKRGTPKEQIRAVGCGAARPVASNSTAAGKAKNRRVEIVVPLK